MYFQHQDTARIVAIRALEYLDISCAQATIQKDLNIPILASQTEDYLFKFWKGVDANGNDLFDEIVIPVN